MEQRLELWLVLARGQKVIILHGVEQNRAALFIKLCNSLVLRGQGPSVNLLKLDQCWKQIMLFHRQREHEERDKEHYTI